MSPNTKNASQPKLTNFISGSKFARKNLKKQTLNWKYFWDLKCVEFTLEKRSFLQSHETLRPSKMDEDFRENARENFATKLSHEPKKLDNLRRIRVELTH